MDWLKPRRQFDPTSKLLMSVDDVTLNAGSGGSVVATDDVSGSHYQRVKISDGTADSTTHMGVYAEDGVTPATITGPTVVMERDDALGTLTPIEGDWAALRCSAEGALWVQEFNSDAILADTASMDTNLATVAGDTTSLDGKFAAGAALSDNFANPTTTGVGAFAMVWDGATWDRAPGDSTNGLLVNLGANNDVTITSGTVTAVTSITNALPAGTNAIGKLAANSGVDIGDVDVTSVIPGTGATNLGKAEDAAHTTGDTGVQALAVSAASPTARAGTAGDYQPLSVSSVNGALFTASTAVTAGGTTYYCNQGTNTLTSIKASAGQLYWLHCMNLSASVVYLQIFNLGTGSVTLGTTTPNLQFPIPTTGDTNGAGFTLAIPNGIAMGTAISFAITTTKTGSTAATANTAFLNAGYA